MVRLLREGIMICKCKKKMQVKDSRDLGGHRVRYLSCSCGYRTRIGGSMTKQHIELLLKQNGIIKNSKSYEL